MKKQAYGVSRSRDRKGKIVHQELKPYTMCIHTFVGGGGLEPKIIEIVHYECSKSNQNRLLEQLDNERSGT